MELQGKKATHDFLSLYTKSSSFQQEDTPPPPPPPPPPQGFFLKTQDFLRPLERPAENGGPQGGETSTTTEAAGARGDVSVEGPAGRRGPASVEHMLPGGIGTYSITHVPVEPPGGTRAALPAVVVKPEQRSSSGGGGSYGGVVGSPFPSVPECRKPEPGYGHRRGYGGPCAPAAVEASPCAAWEEKDPTVGLRGGHAQQRWSSLFAAGPAGPAGATSRYHSVPENWRFMEAATSRSSKGFDEEEDEDEERGRRDGSTSRKDLSIKVDGKGSGSDQRPNTPRSKHSATEQRRRSKINDRFQILRELIPHSDQKRDKASFLLEVIEYIRFLQERVQKYESSFPEWNQDTSKLIPWNNSQAHVDSLTDPSQVVKGSASPYIFPGRFDESSIPVAPAIISNANNQSETDISSGALYKSIENASGFTNADSIASQDQSQWLRSSGFDCAVSNQTGSGQEELAIDEGTISVSAAYSQGLLSTFMQTLQSSGIDLSQATVSVQINLGKRAMNKRSPATAPPNNKDADPSQAAGFRAGEESSQTHKRKRVDNN